MTRPHIRPATYAEKTQMECALLLAVIDRGIASTDDAHDRYELPSDVEPRSWAPSQFD